MSWLVWLSGLSMAHEPKGRQFNPQSWHMPGLQAKSPVGGVGEVTNPCFSCTLMFLSLSLVPSPLTKNK